eukprot:g1521.t1
MSVSSRESAKSVLEVLSERLARTRDRFRRPLRRSHDQRDSNTDIPPADDRSVASFHSDPTLTEEANTNDWDDVEPEIKKIESFALPPEILIRLEEEEVEMMSKERRHLMRFIKKFGLPTAAVILVAVFWVRK